MKKPLLIPAFMIIAVGVGVFLLPFMLDGQTENAELIGRSSTIGGGLIGLGLAFALVVAFKKPK